MQETREDSLDIRQILQTLRKHIGLIIVFTLLTTAAGAVYTFFMATPMYSATTQLVVKLSDSEANAQYAGQVQGNLQIMNTLNQVIVSPAILNPVKTKLNLSESVGQLQSSITATSSANSQVIVLTAKSPYPSLATDIANTTAEIFTQNVTKELNVQNVSILAPAEPNTNLTPISPKPKTYLAIAAAAGLLIGILIAFLLELLNTKVRSEQDLEALGLLSLGTVYTFTENDFKANSKVTPNENSQERASEKKQRKKQEKLSEEPQEETQINRQEVVQEQEQIEKSPQETVQEKNIEKTSKTTRKSTRKSVKESTVKPIIEKTQEISKENPSEDPEDRLQWVESEEAGEENSHRPSAQPRLRRSTARKGGSKR